jgi:hypothetical protein
MRGKVIFIDVDGPLSWGTWQDGKVKIMEGSSGEFTIPYPWVQEDCDALGEIIKQTDARLVVSSDWKKHFGILQLAMIFEHYGIGRWNVMDITTHFNPKKKMSSSLEWDRACEIETWVKQFKPTNWISIDDMQLNFGYKSLGIPQWRHVQVDGDWGKGGRLRDKVDECVKKLNR